MTPDDRIRDAFGALADGLRDDIARRTARAAAEVRETGRAAEDGIVQRLLEAVTALGAASSLTDVLDTFSREAARMLPGSSLMLMRDGAAHSDLPLKVGGELVAVLRIDQTADDDTRRWKPALDVMTRFAAQRLEVITARRSAELLATQGAGALSISSADRGPDDEAARRYARLLVSEIRLYHEAAVLEGRRARDLSSRLAGEIARARSLYNQRVGEDGRLAQYFRDELVRTLADGDATLV